MICVSLGEPTLEACLAALKGVEFAEIRLDKMQLSKADVHTIFSQPVKLLATCWPGTYDDTTRWELLTAAIEAGAAYVDVEVEDSDAFKSAVVERARAKGCPVIVSFHDWEKTPQKAELDHIVGWCFDSGADIAKIACVVHSERDNARLVGLLDSERKLIVVGIGPKGRITRLTGPLFGSQFTFVSSEKGKETADGQLDRATSERIIEELKHV